MKMPSMKKQANPDYPISKQLVNLFLVVASGLSVVVARHYFEAEMSNPNSSSGLPENFTFTTSLPSGGFLFTRPSPHINTAIHQNKNNSTNTINTINDVGSVLFLHSNAGQIHDWDTILNGFRNKKMTVHFLQYAGFGNAKNIRPSLKTISQDLREAWQVLKEMNPLDGGLVRKTDTNFGPYTEIIVIGYDLGGALVTQWLQEVPREEFPKGIILLNTPAGTRSVVSHVTEFPPLTNLFENGWSAQKGLQRYTNPDESLSNSRLVENTHNVAKANSDNVGYVCIVYTQNDFIVALEEAAKLEEWSAKRARSPLLLTRGNHFTSIGLNFWYWASNCL